MGPTWGALSSPAKPPPVRNAVAWAEPNWPQPASRGPAGAYGSYRSRRIDDQTGRCHRRQNRAKLPGLRTRLFSIQNSAPRSVAGDPPGTAATVAPLLKEERGPISTRADRTPPTDLATINGCGPEGAVANPGTDSNRWPAWELFVEPSPHPPRQRLRGGEGQVTMGRLSGPRLAPGPEPCVSPRVGPTRVPIP